MASKSLKKNCIFVVKRYSGNGKPFSKKYEISFDADTTVLDAINSIKERQDATLSYRSSCNMGICGSCGATVNGKPVLMCQTFVKNLKKPVNIEPLRNFPIIKDLVSDTGDSINKMRYVLPYLKREKEKTIKEGEYLQTKKQLKKISQTSKCIKCFLCVSACPVYGLDKDFIDPAVSSLAYRYIADSRDGAKRKRLDKTIGAKGVWNCSFIGECSRVCPKNVDPATAIQKLKIMGSLRSLKKLISKK